MSRTTRWMIHLKDGKTLTEADCFPHETEIMANLGYAPDDITSVERIVAGKILTIKKSPFIEDFFVATEASRDMAYGAPGGGNLPTIIHKQWIGCYLKGSDPPIQCTLVMNAKSHDAWLECFRVKKKTKKGINAKRLKPLKGELRKMFTKQMIDVSYSIVQTPVIKKVFNTPTGIGCLFRKPGIRAEMLIRDGNVLIAFMQPDEKLRIIE